MGGRAAMLSPLTRVRMPAGGRSFLVQARASSISALVICTTQRINEPWSRFSRSSRRPAWSNISVPRVVQMRAQSQMASTNFSPTSKRPRLVGSAFLADSLNSV